MPRGVIRVAMLDLTQTSSIAFVILMTSDLAVKGAGLDWLHGFVLG